MIGLIYWTRLALNGNWCTKINEWKCTNALWHKKRNTKPRVFQVVINRIPSLDIGYVHSTMVPKEDDRIDLLNKIGFVWRLVETPLDRNQSMKNAKRSTKPLVFHGITNRIPSLEVGYLGSAFFAKKNVGLICWTRSALFRKPLESTIESRWCTKIRRTKYLHCYFVIILFLFLIFSDRPVHDHDHLQKVDSLDNDLWK